MQDFWIYFCSDEVVDYKQLHHYTEDAGAQTEHELQCFNTILEVMVWIVVTIFSFVFQAR